jgi:hypothetical protein
MDGSIRATTNLLFECILVDGFILLTVGFIVRIFGIEGLLLCRIRMSLMSAEHLPLYLMQDASSDNRRFLTLISRC